MIYVDICCHVLDILKPVDPMYSPHTFPDIPSIPVFFDGQINQRKATVPGENNLSNPLLRSQDVWFAWLPATMRPEFCTITCDPFLPPFF